MSTEMELKLQLEPQHLRRLRRHPLLQRLKLARPTTRQQISVYYDSDDFALREMGVALRVRHIGRRRIQTVKTMGACVGGAWARDEWEWEISTDHPELSLIDDTPAAALFSAPHLRQSLRAVFTTEVKRSAYRLGGEGWEVELAIDEGQLTTARGAAPIAEIELELISGEAGRLFDLAMELQQDLPGRLSAASKSARGYHLAGGTRPRPEKGSAPALPQEATAAEAFSAIAHGCIGQLLINQDCLIETHDPEAVHQMRVALRRLRSAMSLFGPMLATPQTDQIKEELRWLMGILGPARDTDVFIEEILEPLAAPLADEPGYQALLTDYQARKQACYGSATEVLHGARFTRLVLSLGKWCDGGDWLLPMSEEQRQRLERPARELAIELLDKREAKIRKGLRRLATLDAPHRHLLRVQIKKLRYASEFFVSLFPGRKGKKTIAALGALQDQLGQLNDIAVAYESLKRHAEALGDPTRLWAAGLIGGLHLARLPSLLKEARKCGKAWAELPAFWRAS